QRAGGLAGAAAGAVGDRENCGPIEASSATVAGSFSAPFGVRGGYSSNEIVGLLAGTENRLDVPNRHAHQQDTRRPRRPPSVPARPTLPPQAYHPGCIA